MFTLTVYVSMHELNALCDEYRNEHFVKWLFQIYLRSKLQIRVTCIYNSPLTTLWASNIQQIEFCFPFNRKNAEFLASQCLLRFGCTWTTCFQMGSCWDQIASTNFSTVQQLVLVASQTWCSWMGDYMFHWWVAPSTWSCRRAGGASHCSGCRTVQETVSVSMPWQSHAFQHDTRQGYRSLHSWQETVLTIGPILPFQDSLASHLSADL